MSKTPTTVLVAHIGLGMGTPEGHQVIAIQMHERLLRKRLGVQLRLESYRTLDELGPLLEADDSAIAIVLAHWKVPSEAVQQVLAAAKQRRPGRQLVFLDFFAPTATSHWGLLPVVDRYAKRQLLRDRSLYGQALQGGGVFPDYLSREGGYDLKGWYFGSTPDMSLMNKVVAAWSLGVVPLYRDLSTWGPLLSWSWAGRKFDVSLRLGLVPNPAGFEWYEFHRHRAQDIVYGLPGHVRTTGKDRIRRGAFLMELLRTKIVVSPFGWGEVCFRDYEAVACGCLLIKPSMAHLETTPHIYEDWVTYVPVRWDLADLEEKILEMLANPEKARKIAATGQRRLRQYFSEKRFVDDFARVIGVDNPR